ncbi:ring finger protein [Souris virus]|uniref:RING finger protein Z n=1 Tax=Souris virus TaxID=2010246 RepID=A0A0B6CDG0_9VIRU|nr:ring finger protein [Souris virus]AJI43720.1 ring finger protein [Souris virus]
MGNKATRPTTPGSEPDRRRAELVPDSSHYPAFCKSCWFESKGLIKCHDHNLCLRCLTVFLSVSERCPICKHPLPTKLKTTNSPSAPPPPPYSPK